MLYWLAAVPPEIAGLPTWVLNGFSIGGLVAFILTGLVTSRLWTKSQVDKMNEQHERENANMIAQHAREIANMKERYETHLSRTVEMLQSRAEDAVRREEEWRGVAEKWQVAATTLGDSVDGMQEQSLTILGILQEMQRLQRSAPRKQGR